MYNAAGIPSDEKRHPARRGFDEIKEIPRDLPGGKHAAEDLEVRVGEALELVGQITLLDLVRQGQLLHQALLAELLGMQRDVLQHDRDLHADRGQQVQIVDAEANALAEAIDLDDAEPATVQIDERDANDRMQIEGGDRLDRLVVLVGLQILAEQADAFLQSALHDGSAKRMRR